MRIFIILLIYGLDSIKSSDITLLVERVEDSYNLACVATGDETLVYAMTWIPHDNSNDFINITSKYINSSIIESFDKKQNLTREYRNFTADALYYDLPLVLDHRWENFNSFHKITNENDIRVNTFTNNMEDREVDSIQISILLSNPVCVVLRTKYGTYNININKQFLGTQSNSTIPCKFPPESEKRKRVWTHFVIFLWIDDTLFITKCDNVKMCSDKKAKKFTFDTLAVHSQTHVTPWKLHNYKFLHLQHHSSHKLFNKMITKGLSHLCFFLYMDHSCSVNISVCLENGDCEIMKTFSTEKVWIEEKLDLTKINNTDYNIFLAVSKNCKFAAIDDLRSCSVNETRILNIALGSPKASCVSLTNTNEQLFYRATNNVLKNIKNNYIGNANNISCEYIGKETYCPKQMICNFSECFCAPGYTGPFCQTAIPKVMCYELDLQRIRTYGMNQKLLIYWIEPLSPPDDYSYGREEVKIVPKIIKVQATSAILTFDNIDKDIVTSCDLFVTLQRRTQTIKINGTLTSSNNEFLFTGLIPNAKYEYSILSNCLNFTPNGIFTTSKCLGLTEGNIRRTVNAKSIIIHVNDQQSTYCPISLYNVYLNNSTKQKLINETIENLESLTNYTIKLELDNPSWSFNGTNILMFREMTDYSVPGKIKNMTLKRILGDVFELSFVPPKHTVVLGYVLNYTLKGSDMCSELNYTSCIVKWNGTNSRINITNVLPNHEYDIKVQAYNNKGVGIPFYELVHIKAQDEFSVKEMFINITTNGISMQITYPNCSDLMGPLFYRIQSTCLEKWCTGLRNQINLTYANEISFGKFIFVLTPYANHNFEVLASRNNITYNTSIANYTRITPPGTANSAINLTSYSHDNQSISVRWCPPYPPTGEIEYYEINYCRNNNCNVVRNYSNCELWDSYLCADLDMEAAFLTYNITVGAKNKFIETVNHTSPIMVKAEENPSEAPYIFAANNTAECDIVLEWTHPDKTNGPINYYNIRLTEIESNKSTNTKVKYTIERIYTYKLKNLTAKQYNVSIEAHNQFEGNQSNVITTEECIRQISKNNNIEARSTKEGRRTHIWMIVFVTMTVIFVACGAILLYLKFIHRNSAPKVDIESDIEEAEMYPLAHHGSSLVKKTGLRALLSILRNEFGENILDKEFENIRDPQNLSQFEGNMPENRFKNRFRNVIPFDDTRVVLQDRESDYINANFIKGYAGEKTYIATQCPKTETAYDFWYMVWQERVKIIVCLSTISEGSKKMYQYWPEDFIHVQFEDIRVSHKSNSNETDFVVRHLVVTRAGESRDILQLNYMSWPDQSIPLFPQSFLKFLRYIQSLCFNDGPTVVHCSAGIGRTGTYIVCDNLLRTQGVNVDVLENVERIRRCRPLMVSRSVQYKLIYFILDECINGKNTEITNRQILEMRNSEVIDLTTKHYNYVFERQYAYDMLYSVSEAFADSSEMPSVFVDGYQGERKFINIKLQSPKNFNNIWWTIEQNDIKTIFVLQETNGVNMFWPTDLAEKKVESFSIMLESSTDHEDISVYDLSYRKSGNEALSVKVYYYKSWKVNSKYPSNKKTFHQLYKFYETLSIEDNYNVMLCCHDGILACGLFITLDLALKKLATDQVLDICWAVLGIRPHHKGFMEELEQFKFVYAMIKYYIVNTEQRHYENI